MAKVAANLKRDLEEIKVLLFLKAPFLGTLLTKTRVVLNGEIPTIGATTAGEVLVNPFYWSGLTETGAKTFLLLHEALHLGFRHPWAMDGKDEDAWNLAADMVVNEMLFAHGYNKPPRNPITAFTIQRTLNERGLTVGVEELRRCSVDEVYRLLVAACEQTPSGSVVHDDKDLLVRLPDPNAEVVQDSPMGYQDPGQYWRTALAEALVIAQQAGVLPNDVARQVEASLQVTVNWRRQLRGSLQAGTGRNVVSDWQSVSRRYASLPGIKRLGVQTVWVLLDCSGSITDDVLSRFTGEVFAMARSLHCELKVVPWDAEVYPAITVQSHAQARIRVPGMLRGGGGTLLKPVLDEVGRRLRSQDIVVILSDGYLADGGEYGMLKAYSRLSRRAAKMVFVTTGRVPELPRTRTILMA